MRSVLALLLCLPALAQAQDAQALLAEGTALREQRRDVDALDRFQRAFALEASGQAMAQIALAEQALGRFVEAEAHMQDALSRADDRFVRRNRPLLEQALGEMTARVGELTIHGGVPGATLRIGGEARGTLPLPSSLRLIAGSVHVEVEAEGYQPFSAEVDVPAAGAAELEVALVALPPELPAEPPPEPPPPPPAPNSWALPIGAAGASLGGAGLVVASVLMYLRENDAQARLRCTDTGNPSCQGLFSEALAFEAASIVTYVISGLILAPSVVLVALGILEEPHDRRPGTACLPLPLGVACQF